MQSWQRCGKKAAYHQRVVSPRLTAVDTMFSEAGLASTSPIFFLAVSGGAFFGRVSIESASGERQTAVNVV